MVTEALDHCRHAVKELKDVLDAIVSDGARPSKALQRLKAQGRRMVYPFKKSTVQGLMENVESCTEAMRSAADLLDLIIGASASELLKVIDDRLVNGIDSIEDAVRDLLLSQVSTQENVIREIAKHASETQSNISVMRDEARDSRLLLLARHERLAHALSTNEDRHRAQQIIDSLGDEELYRRREQVASSVEATFELIFDHAKFKFASWLKDGSGIFWIRGKAGSGKSTLMNYILDHERTDELLAEWAGGNNLIIANHFFWVAGTTLQKSNQGLSQALLHQVLRAIPDAVPIVCKRRWDASVPTSRQWTRNELYKVLLKVVATSGVKFRFFIDGLDEYHPENEHVSLVREIGELSSHPNVKIVVSSRPWKVLESAFESSNNILRMEDLTQRDIVNYVKDRLLEASKGDEFECVEFAVFDDADTVQEHIDNCIGVEEQEAWQVVESVVERAEGVFLWVSMVIDALCERLRGGQAITALQKRVNDFPQQLEDYCRDLMFKRLRGSRSHSSNLDYTPPRLKPYRYRTETPRTRFLKNQEQNRTAAKMPSMYHIQTKRHPYFFTSLFHALSFHLSIPSLQNPSGVNLPLTRHPTHMIGERRAHG